MNAQSLAEKSSGRDPNDLGYAPVVVTPQLLRKNGGQYRAKVKGSRWRIRSDFPLMIYADAQPLAIGGALPNIAFPAHGTGGPWLTLDRNVSEFTFRAIGGFGDALDPEVYKAHGVCVVEGCPGDQSLPTEAAPDLLPVHTYELAIPVGAAAVGDVSATFLATTFQFAGISRMPKEFWVKSLAAIRTVDAGGALSASAVQRVDVRKNDNPVGDGTSLIVACNNAAAWSASMPNAKLPLYALLQQYAAEAPAVQVVVRVAADAGATTVRVYLTGAYSL